MAAEDDRGALGTGADSAAPPAGPRHAWLSLIAFALVLSLAAVAWVQVQQAGRLSQTLQTGAEMVVVDVHQAESEYLRLLDQWHQALEVHRPLDRRALVLRYELWVSRITLLRGERSARVAQDGDDFQEALGRVDAFIARADKLLQGNAAAFERADLQALAPSLWALGTDIHDMSLGAAQHVSNYLTERNLALRKHNQIALALTTFLSLLVVAFATIAWRQLRQLDDRRLALERLAEHLRAARQDAEAASQAKSTFLANMSHELRTPFQGLMGMLSLLRETGLSPRQIDYLRTATESADHLLNLLNDVLDVSQLESGRLSLMPISVDLRTMLRDVEALMRPQATAKQLVLHLDADPAVPERVLLDPTRVKQVLFNLLSNAIKFSDRGAVVLDVRLTTLPAAGGEPALEFVVTDTGIGMDERTLHKLFQRFVRADMSTGRRHGGTGLGLEISRSLARLMGGDLVARSKLGEGSRFTFTLPLRGSSVDVAVPLLTIPDPALPPSQPLRILVAEDHPVNRQYLAALLETLGHQAHFVGNGDEAIQAARERRFDLVLMDLHMPVTDGVAATRAIRALPDRLAATVPIVALTADAFPETRDRCLVAGMNDFLTKPVSPQKLAATLRRLFGSSAGAETATASEGGPAEPLPAHAGVPLLDSAAVAGALQAIPTERLAAMIEAFLDQGPALVQRLRIAVRDAQPLELRVQAHAARGVALNLGLSALASTAEALQDGAAHLPAHEIARLVQRFEELLPRTRQAVELAGLASVQIQGSETEKPAPTVTR